MLVPATIIRKVLCHDAGTGKFRALWEAPPSPSACSESLTTISGCPTGWKVWAIVLLTAMLLSCSTEPEERQVEEAFAARGSVTLKEELKPNAPVVATLGMGERVEIVGRRRRFLRVRTSAGAEGWTRDSELATPRLLDFMRQQREQTADDPSQGTFLALYPLNVHLEPYRWSPTIYQLQEEEAVELLRRKLVDRLPNPPEPDKPPPAPTGIDDWSLLRLANGQVGWVLSAGMYSGIPDEVKQYAERRRITSYASLGKTEVGEGATKDIWLWTQAESGKLQYDFDVFRVFKWSGRVGGYQTIKIEYGLEGYLPIETYPQLETKYGTGPGFSVIVEKNEQRLQRTYVVLSFRVQLVEEKPAPPPQAPIRFEEKTEPPAPPPSLVDRIREWWSPSA